MSKRILVYAHLPSTIPPVSGVGRHANALVDYLADKAGYHVEVLASAEHIGKNGILDARSPLSRFATRTYPGSERGAEKSWKLLGLPTLDRHLNDVDLVYSPFGTLLPIRTKPWIVTIHDLMAYEKDLPWSSTWRHRLFWLRWAVWCGAAARRATRVLTVSEFSKGRIVKLLKVPSEKVVVIGNGVDRAFSIDAQPAGAMSDKSEFQQLFTKPFLLVVGGLTRHKGGEAVIGVAKTLLARNSDLQIVITGNRDSGLAQQAERLRNIQLLPRVSDHELCYLFRRAIALLFMSWYEGFGIPPLEAMAVGTPVIVSNQASLPEVVADAGLVVSPADCERVADWAIELQSNSELRERLIARGLERASNFSWAKCGERLQSVIDDVLN